MNRDRKAPQLRAIAPIVASIGEGGSGAPRLVGPLTLVANGERVIGVTSAELLRPLQGTPLVIATKLDGSATLPIAGWFMGRYSGIGIVELAGALPAHDVEPLRIDAVHASVNVHGAPAAIGTVVALPNGEFTRVLVPAHVDADDGGGMTDHTVYLASPLDVADAQIPVEGGAVFAWLPPEPALGRPGETVVFALAYPYRAQVARPRDTPVIAELIGLDDLGKALLAAESPPDERPELASVTGEIADHAAEIDPLRGLDE